MERLPAMTLERSLIVAEGESWNGMASPWWWTVMLIVSLGGGGEVGLSGVMVGFGSVVAMIWRRVAEGLRVVISWFGTSGREPEEFGAGWGLYSLCF